MSSSRLRFQSDPNSDIVNLVNVGYMFMSIKYNLLFSAGDMTHVFKLELHLICEQSTESFSGSK